MAEGATPPPRAADGVWVYCVTRAGAELPRALPAVQPGTTVRRIDDAGLTALASAVPLSEFGERALPDHLNDLAWLERVARTHEAVLEAALAATTIVPLRLCTIYRDERGVADMLGGQRALLQAALDALNGRQEWGVKLIVDPQAVEAAARERSPAARALERELEGTTEAGAYMLRRRIERQLARDEALLVEELARDVHARLAAVAADAVLNRSQSRALARYEGEMVLNGAYLVTVEEVGRLRELVGALGERHRRLGARLELTGPWPPYNFAPVEATPVTEASG